MSDLIVRDDASLSVAIAIEAVTLKEDALNASAMVNTVSDPGSLETATGAAQAVTAVIRSVEKARVAVKEPVLDLGRKIDALAKSFVEELKTEELRVNKMIGDYVTEQRMIQMRKEAEAAAELRKLEEEKQKALAAAKTVAQVQAIEERAVQAAQAIAPPPPPPPPKGLTVKVETDFDIVDQFAFDLFVVNNRRYDLGKVEASRTGIKTAVAKGEKIPGVRVREVTKTQHRTTPAFKTIDV